jgi:hypothetical protein
MTAQPERLIGPELPDIHDLWAAQAAPHDAHIAGCSDAEYDRLLREQVQTEAAYLDGYDRRLEHDLAVEDASRDLPYADISPGRELESDPDLEAEAEVEWDPEAEADWAAEWDSAGPDARAEAGLEPGEPEAEI